MPKEYRTPTTTEYLTPRECLALRRRLQGGDLDDDRNYLTAMAKLLRYGSRYEGVALKLGDQS